MHLLDLLPFQQLWPIEGSRAQVGRHWVMQPDIRQVLSPLVLCSSSSHLLFVCAHTSHFTGALLMLSHLHLPSGHTMPVTFNAPLNTLLYYPLTCCPGSFCTSLGKRPSPFCAVNESRWGSMQVCLFFHSAIFMPIV